MALAGDRYEIEEIGTTVTVPNNPRARLMFYLYYMIKVMNLDPEREQRYKKISDFRNWHLLNEEDVTFLVINCTLFVPSMFIGECIFLNEEACGDSQNTFREITVSDGQSTVVRKIMFYKPSFLTDNYYIPLTYFQDEIDLIRRAEEHIDGKTTSRNTFSPSSSTTAVTRSSCCNIL